MITEELYESYCNTRKLSKQLCCPIKNNPSISTSHKKPYAPSSYESYTKCNLCESQGHPHQAESELKMFNTYSVVSTFVDDEDATKQFRYTYEEESKLNDDNSLESIKSPHCEIPQCNEIKDIIERASPKASSYSKFIINTYSSFAYFHKANLQEPTKQDIFAKSLNIPQKTNKKGKKTIIFDLDETLVLCKKTQGPNCFPSIIQTTNGKMAVYFSVRPYTQECLQKLAQHYELIAFTAGQKEYANAIINIIDPQRQHFDYLLTRENCIEFKQSNLFIKDLRIIGRALKDVAIVDNNIISFFFQLNNGWPIFSYDGDSKDKALVDLTQFFMSNMAEEDIRAPLKKKFRLEELAQCAGKNILDIVEIYEENNDDSDGMEDIPLSEVDNVKRRRSAMIIDQNLVGIKDYISKMYK